MKRSINHKEVGSTIVVVMSILATLLVLVGVSFDYTSTINRNVARSDSMENAFAIADGTLDMMFGYWREVCRSQPNMAWQTDDLGNANIPLPTSAQFPNVPNFSAVRATNWQIATDNLDPTKTVSNFKIAAVDPQWKDLPAISSTPNPGIGQQKSTATYNYMAAVDVTLPTKGGNITAKVRRVFQKEQMSPWNYAIFYVDPLEIHPSPQFIVTGPVHTNSDLFTAHSTLTFMDKVTYGHLWYKDFMPGDCTHSEPPQSPHYPLGIPPALDAAKQPFGLDSSRIFNSGDTNPNNDSYHELVDVPKIDPSTGQRYPDPLQGQRYYDQAAIKVLIDGSNNLTIMKQDGTVVTGSSNGNDLKMYNAMVAAISTGQSITDNREGGAVRITTLDVSSVVDAINNNRIKNWNGVIYISDTSSTPTLRRAIRLRNGKVLPNGGLTVASSNPVYIQGDYNTGNGTPPSNTGDPLNPTVLGYTRQPASVIADAVNILSNNWSDANAPNVSNRVATNTTVNTAIVAGIVPSGNCFYSGGAENFPRFHEDWSNNITFTYYGSMVELYTSNQATGNWGKANVYNPPIRLWYFDTNFNTMTPPGSLMLYSYIKGRWSIAP
jgi:hypothetical protein